MDFDLGSVVIVNLACLLFDQSEVALVEAITLSLRAEVELEEEILSLTFPANELEGKTKEEIQSNKASSKINPRVRSEILRVELAEGIQNIIVRFLD